VSAVNVFVGDYYFFFGLGDERPHRLGGGVCNLYLSVRRDLSGRD
jgi:hypothetical protein